MIEQSKKEKSEAEQKAEDEFKIRSRTQEESKKLIEESKHEANKIIAKENIKHNKKTIKFMLDKLTIPNLKMRYGEKVPYNMKKHELIELIIKKEKLDDEPETPQIIPDRLSQIDYI